MSLLASFTRGRLAIIPGALAAGALVFAGCGGDDDGGNGGGGSDEEYVATLCDGLKEFSDELTDVISNADDEQAAFDALGDAMRSLADTLDDADPPADIQEANDNIVTTFRDAADKLEEGDEAALDDIGDGADLDIDPEVQERLQAVAEETDSCVELEDSGFGDLFGDSVE